MKERQFLSEVEAAAGLSTRREAERWAKAVAGALADLAPDAETRRHVGAALGVHAPEARRALLAVWGVIRGTVSAGELADFQARVPRDVAAFQEAA